MTNATPVPPRPRDGEQAVLEQIMDIAVTQLELPLPRAREITAATPLVGGLELDSLGQTILLAEIEERFGFAIGLEERTILSVAETIGDLIQFILARATRYPS